MEKIKALVKAQAAPGIWLEEVQKPSLGPQDVLIKIEKTAICGTDMHIYHWDEWAQKNIPVPMIVGHEFYGRIVACGSEVTNLNIGDRVSGEGHLVCGHCKFCRTGLAHLCPKTQGIGVNTSGAFTQYLRMPSANVILLPEELTDDIAAILDPFGNAAHCVFTYDVAGKDVLITGAGPIGMMAVALAKHCGARRVFITDVNDYRLNLAKQMGADAAVHIQKESLQAVMAEFNIEGFGVGLEMSGNSKAFNDMISVLENGAGIALLGILPQQTHIDWNQVIFKCLNIQGIYGRKMYSTWYKMMAMLQAGLDISSVITHRFSVKDYQQGFDTMASGLSGKVLLDWSNI